MNGILTRPVARHGVAAACVCALAGAAAAQVQWRQAGTEAGPRPPPRADGAMAGDPVRGLVVLLGGAGAAGAVRSDTWVWNGTGWFAVPAGPAARRAHALAWDPTARCVLLFGGFDGRAPLGDTWCWNGSWQRRAPRTSPSPRQAPAMAADAAGRVVLFGGLDATGSVRNDTWSWTGTDWVRERPPLAPPPRQQHAMALDPSTGVVLMFGGRDAGGAVLDDTWAYFAGAWTRLDTAGAPRARAGHAMVSDVPRQRVVLFGGEAEAQTVLGDTWEWDTTGWVRRVAASPPPARRGPAMAQDPVRGQTVLFSGDHGKSLLDGTWLYEPQHAARYTPFGAGCATDGAAPSLRAVPRLLPWSGCPFAVRVGSLPPRAAGAVLAFGLSAQRWRGVPLPLPLGALGLPACRWYVSIELGLALPTASAPLTVPFPIPNAAALLGASFFNQALVFDLGAPGLAAISNAAVGTIGGK